MRGALLAALVHAATVEAAPVPLAAAREYVMGTIAEVRIYDAPAARARPALAAALREIRTVDRLMAVQRPESELSRVNRGASAAPVAVGWRLMEVLRTSARVSRLTAGAFDVTVLPAVPSLALHGAPARGADGAGAVAGFRHVVLDPVARTVRFTDPRTGIDLGGIAKGYALDRARAVLERHGVTSAYLDLGGNVATVGRPPDGPWWRIGIRHPRDAGALLGVVEVGETAVSTSGDAERPGHIIDPRRGGPARALVSATVVTESATLGDALSTAAVVLGAGAMRPLLARLSGGGVFARAGTGGVIAVSTTPGVRFRAAP
jgi:thiamine biosynthesis lipoprotein